MKRANEPQKRLVHRAILAVGLVAAATIAPVASGDYFEGPKLTASDGAQRDDFGTSVSIRGDVAIIGAPFDDDNGSNSGAAYVYRRDGSRWIQEQKLTASDGRTNDRFGRSVSISGTVAIVGAPLDDFATDPNMGSAYVYRYNGTRWVEEQKLTASDGNDDDQFGVSVSIDFGVAIVGAWRDDDGGPNTGSAYVFRRGRAGWFEEEKFTDSVAEVNGFFGISVSISGNFAIVGALFDDHNGVGSGAAFFFRKDGTTWIDAQKLTALDGAPGDHFGTSVSVRGSLAIIGAPSDGDRGLDSGSAYVYRHDGAFWVVERKLIASDGAEEDFFGRSVSISGDVAIVGAFFDDGRDTDTGSAYVYRHDGSTWIEQPKITASDGARRDLFGFSVAVDGDVAIAGAIGRDENGSDSGAAYILERAVMVGEARGDQAGRAVADIGDIDGDGYTEIVVGAPFSDEKSGQATVYDGRTFLRLFSKTGQKKGDLFGHAVAGAGDVNRDGIPDIVVAAPGHDRGTGRVDVYSGLDGRRLHRMTGAARGDRFGWSVAGGLDVNDDGRDDFVVGAPKNDEAGASAGKVYVYSGRNGRELETLRGAALGDRFGWSVALLHANNDDFADVLVGAPRNDAGGANAGQATVFSGKSFRRLHTVGGKRAGDQHGYVVTALVNPSGRDDFAVGSPFYDKGRKRSAGRVVVYAGRNGRKIFDRAGEAKNDRLGESLASAGDVDIDGRVDLIIGVPRHGRAGRVYVRSGADGSLRNVADGDRRGDDFGYAVAGGYHDAGDERTDPLVGAPGADQRGSKSGRVHVLRSEEGPLARYDEPDEADDHVGEAALSPLGTYFPDAPWADELVHLLSQWGADADDADENGDGVVDVNDLLELLEDR